MGKASLTLCLLATLPVVAAAQALPAEAPQGRFLQPTTQVGAPLEYELTFRHAPDLEVIFPDSLADFGPFEYIGHRYTPTRTRQGRSLDRAVYRLRTFALAPEQALSLPVLVLRPHDTLVLRPTPARVRLRFVAPTTPPSGPPRLRQPAGLLPTPPLFNYPYWLAGAAVLLLLGAAGATAFRTRLRRRYAAYKLRKNHQYFRAQFARHMERFTLSRSTTNVERAVTLWKNYLTTLENNGLNSLTSKELVDYFGNDPDVRRALRTTDRVVYGNLLSEDAQEVDRAFHLLRQVAERRYEAVRGLGA